MLTTQTFSPFHSIIYCSCRHSWAPLPARRWETLLCRDSGIATVIADLLKSLSRLCPRQGSGGRLWVLEVSHTSWTGAPQPQGYP